MNEEISNTYDSFSSPVTSYQFGALGSYDVTLKVTDSNGLTGETTIIIEIL